LFLEDVSAHELAETIAELSLQAEDAERTRAEAGAEAEAQRIARRHGRGSAR